MDHLCSLCLVFVMLSRLFIAALWSPVWKWLTSLLSFAMFNCVFVTFPCGSLGQVWYLIESIHDLCHLSNFAYSVHPWADPEGDRGSGPPISGKSQAAIHFLRNTGTDPSRSKGVQLLLVGGLYIPL